MSGWVNFRANRSSRGRRQGQSSGRDGGLAVPLRLPQEAHRGSAATKRIEFWGLEMGVMGASLRRYPNPPALRRGV